MRRFIVGSKIKITQGDYKDKEGIFIKKRGKMCWIKVDDKIVTVPPFYLQAEKVFKFGNIENMFSRLPSNLRYIFLIDNNTKIQPFHLTNSQFIVYTNNMKDLNTDFPLNTIVIEANDINMSLNRDLEYLQHHFNNTILIVVGKIVCNKYKVLKDNTQVLEWLNQYHFSLFEHELEWYL